METRIALIGIIVEETQAIEKLNAILHDYGKYVVGRMGIPYHQKNVCIISIVIDAANDVISSLSGKLGQLPGISIKTVYSKTNAPNHTV
ncbi:TM1266 family iron-only hydrogenase system putative regulator [Oscillospiraceae bacterium PP1C4]